MIVYFVRCFTQPFLMLIVLYHYIRRNPWYSLQPLFHSFQTRGATQQPAKLRRCVGYPWVRHFCSTETTCSLRWTISVFTCQLNFSWAGLTEWSVIWVKKAVFEKTLPCLTTDVQSELTASSRLYGAGLNWSFHTAKYNHSIVILHIEMKNKRTKHLYLNTL